MRCEILNYSNEVAINSIREFLKECNCYVPQQDPFIKDIYDNPNTEFIYLYCVDDNNIVGVLPFVIYRNDIGNIIQSLPRFGYGGIVVKESIKKRKIMKLLCDKMIKIGEENQCIVVTMGTSVLDDNLEIYKEVFKPDFVKDNFYQYNIIDELPINKLSSKSKNQMKRKIKKVENKGINIIINDHEYFDDFYKIHKDRFKKINATPMEYSFLKSISFNLCKKGLADSYYILLEGEIQGGCIILKNNNICDYVMSSYTSLGLEENLNYYVCNTIHQDIYKNGITFFNWESSPSKEGGVYEFKRRWGARESKHFYLTKVIGDLSVLNKCKISQLKSNYNGYFIMPFNELIKYCEEE